MEAENDLIFIKSYGSIVDLQYVSSSVGLPWGLRGKKKKKPLSQSLLKLMYIELVDMTHVH